MYPVSRLVTVGWLVGGRRVRCVGVECCSYAVIVSRASSRGVVVEAVEEPVEDLGSSDLALGGGVVALSS